MEAGRVSEFWVRGLNLQFHKESFPWDHMHVECENKGLTSLANVSAPSELGIVSGEFLFYSCSVIPAALPPKTAGTDFSKSFSLSFLHHVLWFCDASSKEWGPSLDGLDLWADLPFGPWLYFGVLLSAWRCCRSVWLVVKVMWSNLPLDWAVIHLYFYGTVSQKYYSRSFRLKSNKGLNLESVFLILFYYWSWLRVVLCGGNGFGNSADKPHFLCLGCSWRLRQVADPQGVLPWISFFLLFHFCRYQQSFWDT